MIPDNLHTQLQIHVSKIADIVKQKQVGNRLDQATVEKTYKAVLEFLETHKIGANDDRQCLDKTDLNDLRALEETIHTLEKLESNEESGKAPERPTTLETLKAKTQAYISNIQPFDVFPAGVIDEMITFLPIDAISILEDFVPDDPEKISKIPSRTYRIIVERMEPRDIFQFTQEIIESFSNQAYPTTLNKITEKAHRFLKHAPLPHQNFFFSRFFNKHGELSPSSKKCLLQILLTLPQTEGMHGLDLSCLSRLQRFVDPDLIQHLMINIAQSPLMASLKELTLSTTTLKFLSTSPYIAPNLNKLNLLAPEILPSDIQSLNQISNLKALELKGFFGEGPALAKAISHLNIPTLESLSCHLEENSVKELANNPNLSHLTSLTVVDGQVSADLTSLLTEIPWMTQLEMLEFSGGTIESESFSIFAKSPNLINLRNLRFLSDFDFSFENTAIELFADSPYLGSKHGIHIYLQGNIYTMLPKQP